MNWQECVMHVAALDDLHSYSRFDWPLRQGRLGFDCNPETFTINDITGAIGWLWTWPGDRFVSWEPVRAFFELGPRIVFGTWWSYTFPFLPYAAAFLAVMLFAVLVANPLSSLFSPLKR